MNNKISGNYKIIFVALFAIIAIIPLMFNVNKKMKPKEQKKPSIKYIDETTFTHESEGIIKNEKVQGVEFSNISLVTKNGQTTFTADVTNVTNSDIKKEDFDIDLLDKNDKVIITLRANIPNGLKKNETKKVSASAKGDFKNIVSKAIKK